MLRLLENATPQDTTVVLLRLLTTHSLRTPGSTKTISLVVKCLGRVISNFMKDFKPDSGKRFIKEAVHYLASIEYENALE